MSGKQDDHVRGLIFDPFAGISGDMILGALVDLGLAPEWIEAFVASLDLEGVDVVVERTKRREIACRRVRFELPSERSHRHLSDVLRIVEGSGAPTRAKSLAAEAFRRLAAAEAVIHGTTPEKIHFHEVGALDSVLDVLCAMAGVVELGFEAFFTRPVALGHGWIDMAHGRYPVPAPATLKLVEGMVVRDTGLSGECTTPTGAAVLSTLTGGCRPPAEVRVIGSGFGAGSRDPEDRPNCLRLIACEVNAAPADALYLVQADMDDLPPEYAPPAQEALLAAGALDAVFAPLMMKKGRPGLRVEALVGASGLDRVIDALFENTSTIGARYWPVVRSTLRREEEVVEWRGQRIRRKRVHLPGGADRSKPEFEDVVQAARALGLAPYQVRTAAELQAGTRPSAMSDGRTG